GSIAFMRDGTAVAVGGTGRYPKREGGEDLAGEGRAWLYDDGFWTELHEPQLQPGMRGMTSVAMSPRVGECKDGEKTDRTACGLAGAYQQLWQWQDGRFVKGW